MFRTPLTHTLKVWFLLSLALFITLQATPPAFVFVIPSYNNALYYERNLDSVFSQTHDQYRVIYIDDASSDGTGALVKAYVQNRTHGSEKVTLIHNPKRQGSLANFYLGVGLCAPEEIVICLDGDDWLFDARVLEKLAAVYADGHVWVTYGQFIHYPSGWPGWSSEVPTHVIQNNAFRGHSWTTTHLKTFYAGLFHKIRFEDLLYGNQFFPMAGDLAFMWPILEMAGAHSRFIPDILYVYNVETPLNDFKHNRPLQFQFASVIQQREKYQPVPFPY